MEGQFNRRTLLAMGLASATLLLVGTEAQRRQEQNELFTEFDALALDIDETFGDAVLKASMITRKPGIPPSVETALHTSDNYPQFAQDNRMMRRVSTDGTVVTAYTFPIYTHGDNPLRTFYEPSLPSFSGVLSAAYVTRDNKIEGEVFALRRSESNRTPFLPTDSSQLLTLTMKLPSGMRVDNSMDYFRNPLNWNEGNRLSEITLSPTGTVTRRNQYY